MGKKSMSSFKNEFSYEERLEESRDIIANTQIESRFLVPRDMSVGQFIHILSIRLHLTPGKALFVFVENTLPQTASLMDTVYESFKDEDGFLYMSYSSEKTFGYADIQIHGH
ncbi:Autophagy-related protein 8i [Vitis vinifera]|uniref:Autophagy-related protein n=1 Tax=Vitis vinifera TaxID=29760 RepID=A0A438E1J2_VITVI|nr:Autophagy-related protein 8i [Vitis vinifera]